MTERVNRVTYEKECSLSQKAQGALTLMEEIQKWRWTEMIIMKHLDISPQKLGPHSRVIFIVMSYSNCHKKCCPGSGVARQRILVSYLVIFWHILSYFHITVRNWRPQHINYDTKRVLANELETQHFIHPVLLHTFNKINNETHLNLRNIH